MIISLNLIPQSYQAKYRKLEFYRLWKNLIGLVAIYLLLTGVLLLVTRHLLQQQFIRILDETTLVTADNRKTEILVTAMNNEVKTAQKLQAGHLPWSTTLLAFSRYMPDGVRLTRADFRWPGISVIEGTATTRETLLELKRTLLTAPGVSAIDLPLSNLLSPTNINFIVRFQLKPTMTTP